LHLFIEIQYCLAKIYVAFFLTIEVHTELLVRCPETIQHICMSILVLNKTITLAWLTKIIQIQGTRPKLIGFDNYARSKILEFDNHSRPKSFGSGNHARSKRFELDIRKKAHGSDMIARARRLG
jgi:hypothetical protein